MKQGHGFSKKRKEEEKNHQEYFGLCIVFVSLCREVKIMVKNKKSLPHVRNKFDFGFHWTVSKTENCPQC